MTEFQEGGASISPLTCPGCYSSFSGDAGHRPHVLPCGHSQCFSCLDVERVSSCASCSTTIPIDKRGGEFHPVNISLLLVIDLGPRIMDHFSSSSSPVVEGSSGGGRLTRPRALQIIVDAIRTAPETYGNPLTGKPLEEVTEEDLTELGESWYLELDGTRLSWGTQIAVLNPTSRRVFPLHLGFKNLYFARNGLQRLGYPVSFESEFHLDGDDGTQQSFDFGKTFWLPSRGCYIESTR